MKKLSYLNLFLIVILISHVTLGAGASAGAQASAKTKPITTFANRTTTPKGLHIVVSKYGENHKVPIARNYPNIIKTPFVKSNALGVNKNNYEFQYHGAFLIITPKDNKPIWISIIDEANPNTTPISLTLIPKNNLDSQTILVSTKFKSSFTDQQSGGFPQQIANVFKRIIMRQVPIEYSISPIKETFTTADNKLQIKKLEKYTSAEFEIQKWKIINKSKKEITLTENMFQKNPNFVAVTFYPKALLKPGGTTNVLIMMGKGI